MTAYAQPFASTSAPDHCGRGPAFLDGLATQLRSMRGAFYAEAILETFRVYCPVSLYCNPVFCGTECTGQVRPPCCIRPEQSKRRVFTRCHRPKPPQTGPDLSCTAANTKRLTGKALAPQSRGQFLRQQHGVVPQNGREAEVRCNAESTHIHERKQTLSGFAYCMLLIVSGFSFLFTPWRQHIIGQCSR